MSHTNYTPDNANEYPAGPFNNPCNATKYYHRYPAVYERQPDGSYAWWTHGVGPGAKVFINPGPCDCTQIGTDPFGNPINACAPRVRSPDSRDYTGSNGNIHYFIAYGSSTPPSSYLLSDG
jgi:hypothetical protein